MNFMTGILKYAAVLLISVSLFAETGARKTSGDAANGAQAQSASNEPTKEVAEAYFKRMFGYDSRLDVKVLRIAPSPIAELSEITAVLITPDGQQLGTWYVSRDLKHAIVGEMLPFGADPFAEDRAKLASGAFGPTKGPADAKMLIVEFADLECPACKEAAPMMQKLRADFPQAKFIFQSFPLQQHPWAMRAASYLDCISRANQDQAFTFIDSVFTHQKEIDDAVRKTDAQGKTIVDDALVTEQLGHYAELAGAEPGKIEACAVTPETAERIARSVELGKAVGVTSTPTLYLNGRRVPGPRADQYDALKEIVSYEADEAAMGK